MYCFDVHFTGKDYKRKTDVFVDFDCLEVIMIHYPLNYYIIQSLILAILPKFSRQPVVTSIYHVAWQQSR